MKKKTEERKPITCTEFAKELERNHIANDSKALATLTTLCDNCGEDFARLSFVHIEPCEKDAQWDRGWFVWLAIKTETETRKDIHPDGETGRAQWVQYNAFNKLSEREYIAQVLTKVETSKAIAKKCGYFPTFWTIYQLKDNKPKTIAEAVASIEETNLYWALFVQEHGAIICTDFDTETKRATYNEFPVYGLFNYRSRQADNETARKNAVKVFLIYTTATKLAAANEKRRQRKENRTNMLTRFDRVACSFSSYYQEQLYRLEKATGFDHFTQEETALYSRYRNYYFSKDQFCYKSQDLAQVFDKSGYYIKDAREELQTRANILKNQRDQERAKDFDFSPYIEEINDKVSDLLADLSALVEKFAEVRAISWSDFYFSHRLEKVADLVSDLESLKREMTARTFNKVSTALDKVKNLRDRYRVNRYLTLNWLDLTETERGYNKTKETAIYYGWIINNGGALALDLEKAEKEIHKNETK